MAEGLIYVGHIVSAHGLHGHLKVKSFTEEPADLFSFPVLYDAQKHHVFEFEKKILPVGGKEKSVFISRLQGVTDRTAAEHLKGQKLYIERAALAALNDPDTFYHTDLIGLAVVDQQGNPLGRVHSVLNFGAGDLLQIETRETMTCIPFTKACVPEINLQEGFVQVDGAQLALFVLGDG